jgi:hypothetical protein
VTKAHRLQPVTGTRHLAERARGVRSACEDPGVRRRSQADVLVDGSYELSGEDAGVGSLDVAGHPVTIDLPALTRR